MIKILIVVDVIYVGGDSKRIIKKGEVIRIMIGVKMFKGVNCVIR